MTSKNSRTKTPKFGWFIQYIDQCPFSTHHVNSFTWLHLGAPWGAFPSTLPDWNLASPVERTSDIRSYHQVCTYHLGLLSYSLLTCLRRNRMECWWMTSGTFDLPTSLGKFVKCWDTPTCKSLRNHRSSKTHLKCNHPWVDRISYRFDFWVKFELHVPLGNGSIPYLALWLPKIQKTMGTCLRTRE